MKVFEVLKEQLKGLELDEEKVAELVEFTKKELPKEWIPKDKFNEKVEELKNVNAKLEETNTKIKELESSTENIDEYKEKLNKLNSELENFKAEADNRVAKLKKKSIIKDWLVSNNADPDNLDLLMYEFNDKIDEMTLKDDNIVGLEDYTTPVKEKREKLFLKEKVSTGKPNDGDTTKPEDKKLKSVRKAMGLE